MKAFDDLTAGGERAQFRRACRAGNRRCVGIHLGARKGPARREYDQRRHQPGASHFLGPRQFRVLPRVRARRLLGFAGPSNAPRFSNGAEERGGGRRLERAVKHRLKRLSAGIPTFESQSADG